MTTKLATAESTTASVLLPDRRCARRSLNHIATSLLQLLDARHQRAVRLERRTATAASGLLEWAAWYLPHHFALPPSAMHRWLAAQLDQLSAARPLKLNVIGPRGSAKSTVATLA